MIFIILIGRSNKKKKKTNTKPLLSSSLILKLFFRMLNFKFQYSLDV